MRSRTFWTLALALLVPCLVACGDDAPPPESADPLVGAMELAISHRNEADAPSNPVRIEVAPANLRVDAHTVLELNGGRVRRADQAEYRIPNLAQALTTGAARRTAQLRIYGSTPWATTMLILNTLKAANIHEVGFEVRAVGGGADVRYLKMSGWDVVMPSEDFVAFDGAPQRQWNEFREVWEEMYTACRAGDYVDCAFKPQNIAENGMAHITLFARGDAMKVEIDRFGVEDEAGPAAPTLLEGILAAPQNGEEVQAPPAVTAAFTFRARVATAEESALSATVRPLCGARSCGTLLIAEGQTETMRVLSFIGAAFPTGSELPPVRFRLNPDEPIAE